MSKAYLSVEHYKKRAHNRHHLKVSISAPNQMNINTNNNSNNILTKSLASYINIIYDQGNLGSCTANAFCQSHFIQQQLKNLSIKFVPSRLYIYYHERLLEGNVNQDAGADVLDGENFAKTHGICSESLYPYNVNNYKMKPPPISELDASHHRITSYRILNNINDIKQSINNNIPVCIAIAVYDSFETIIVANTGIVPLPDTHKEKLLGGHEMCLVGYDDNKHLFLVCNSWGNQWWAQVPTKTGNQKGFCWIPYDYLNNPNLAFEFTAFNI